MNTPGSEVSAARNTDFSEYSPITLAVPSMRKSLFHVTVRLIGWGSRAVERYWITDRQQQPLTNFILFVNYCLHSVLWMPNSVLWHCWLGVREDIRPIKLSDEVLAWLSVWSKVQMICIWSSWCHCHSSSLVSVKSGMVLPFSYRLILEKKPFNGCCCVVVSAF